MQKYYIVTQADTEDNGHFLYANGVFQDDNGNTQLCINAEEARQLIAEDVAEMCHDGTPFGINEDEEVEIRGKKRIINFVLKHMKPEAGQFAEVMFYDGSKRNYTINEITI